MIFERDVFLRPQISVIFKCVPDSRLFPSDDVDSSPPFFGISIKSRPACRLLLNTIKSSSSSNVLLKTKAAAISAEDK